LFDLILYKITIHRDKRHIREREREKKKTKAIANNKQKKNRDYKLNDG